MDYKSIRKSAAKMRHSSYGGGGRTAYATGGRVGKRATTVINIITPTPQGAQGPEGMGPAMPPPGMNGPAMPPPGAPPPMPKPPVSPMAGNAALSAMGGPPMLATGGRVKASKVPKMSATASGFKGQLPSAAGAGGAAGRLKKAKAPAAKYPLTT